MTISRSPSRPCSGPPSYSPDDLPIYRGGSSAAASAVDPDTLFSSGETGDYLDTTLASSVLNVATPVSVSGDEFTKIVGQVTSSDYTRVSGTPAGVWYENALSTTGVNGQQLDTTSLAMNTSSGLLLGLSFSFTGTASSGTPGDAKELCWLRDSSGSHVPPKVSIPDLTSNVHMELLTGIDHTASGLNDGEIHTAIINYDPATENVYFYVDGVLVDTVDATGATHVALNEAAIIYGDRDGIEQDAWKMIFRDEFLPTSQVESLHLWLVENATYLEPPPNFSSANVRTGGDYVQAVFDETITATSPAAGFTITADGSPVTISSAAVYGDKILFDLGSTLTGTETVLLSYDRTTGTVVNAAGGELRDLTDQAVTNNAAEAWTPAEWFIRGEIGDWGDHDAATGLYTDTAGTTPVTTTGDAVARMEGREGVFIATQSTAGSRPLWDSTRGLVSGGDGVTRFLETATTFTEADIADGLTVVLVCQKEGSWTSGQFSRLMFGKNGVATTANLLDNATATTSGAISCRAGNGTIFNPLASGSGTDTSTHVLAMTVPAASSTITGHLDNTAGATTGTVGAVTTWDKLHRLVLDPDGANDPSALKWVVVDRDRSAELDKIQTWAGV